jgi:hypothetical protein
MSFIHDYRIDALVAADTLLVPVPEPVRPSTATRSLPVPSCVIQSATAPISVARSREAAGGIGCRQVDSDSNACTTLSLNPAQRSPAVMAPRAG